jgi:translation initiation factor 2B subunit (eIF-2B alpha/beta/delta family)
MLAAIVKAVAAKRDRMPSSEIEDILEYAIKIHPHNLLIRSIVRDVRFAMHIEGATPETLVECKSRYLKLREQECARVAAKAKRIIDDENWIVVYGFSHVVMTLLTEHSVGRCINVLIVKTAPPSQGYFVPDETTRIEQTLAAAGFNSVTLEMAMLPNVLTRLRQQGRKVKVVLGTRGVFNGGDVLGAPGSSLVAIAARSLGASVYVLAESDKRAVDADTKAAMESLLERLADSAVSTSVSDRDVYSPVDRLTPNDYDEVIYGGEFEPPVLVLREGSS